MRCNFACNGEPPDKTDYLEFVVTVVQLIHNRRIQECGI